MTRSATTLRWRCAAKAPGPKRPTGAGPTCVWRRPVPVAEMTGNVSWRFLPEPQRSTVCANLPRLGGSWDYRCAAHEYRMACAGHCHLLFFNRLMPWDHAPGWLLHQEAGGYSARLDGSPYTPLRTGWRPDLRAGPGELARRCATPC